MYILLALTLSLSTVITEGLPKSICHEVKEILTEAVDQGHLTEEEAKAIGLRCLQHEYI